MKTRTRASLVMCGLFTLGAALPALADCPPRLSCTYENGPCEGSLNEGVTLNFDTFSLGFLNIHTGWTWCYSECEYSMRGAGGEEWTMTTYDLGCDGTGTMDNDRPEGENRR